MVFFKNSTRKVAKNEWGVNTNVLKNIRCARYAMITQMKEKDMLRDDCTDKYKVTLREDYTDEYKDYVD